MTSWDITGLIHNMDLEQLKESITEISTTDLVFMYRSLVGLVDVCLKSANIPIVAFTLSELSYAYGLEIVNRYLFSHGDFREVSIPAACLPEYMRPDANK